ncbi:DUF3784 domain-containing protein [Flavobacteriaceae bacterium S0825]|uniref:DUF3784 domain-containing protein n=1 Tax=Gaetbulibacter sp. S0825 TaxID=2720084 RepID=UPI0014321D06|nr:DUF3784 domain-containing protein [Gaetbulibacter sp. S0825]MCK0109853.1 DUF3784 domain-containing protein [Flavobacteriaceae bacterium S0825]NIX65482.1 DUF3784 domain-containing protein [Gaetbulibacter sp. S0825]
MLFSSLLMGVILIICGFLVKKYPNLIAGYNTLSEDDKEKVDIENLSSMMKRALITIGALIIVMGLIMSLIKVKEHYGLLITSSIVILGVIIMIISAKKFKKKP